MKNFLVIFTLGFGDDNRARRVSLAVHKAVKDAARGNAYPLMLSAFRDAVVMMATSDGDARDLYAAIVETLSDDRAADFGPGLANPDRLVVAEYAGKLIATDKTIQTAAGLA